MKRFIRLSLGILFVCVWNDISIIFGDKARRLFVLASSDNPLSSSSVQNEDDDPKPQQQKREGDMDNDIEEYDVFREDRNDENYDSKNIKTTVPTLSESIQYYRKLFQDPTIAAARKQYWSETLNDIRNLTTNSFGMTPASSRSSNGYMSTIGLFSQWKLALDESIISSMFGTTSFNNNNQEEGNGIDPFNLTSYNVVNNSGTNSYDDYAIVQYWKRRKEQRFEGFPSWERLVQDWNDEIQDYLQQVEKESNEGYSLSYYGRPSPTTATTIATITQDQVESIGDLTDDSITHYIPTSLEEVGQATVDVSRSIGTEQGAYDTASVTDRKRPVLPIPVPAKPGQAVLPHTDISDKSKRILIVTTAAMPWRTGTAVNPLLRAAYLVEGRKEQGGSVTLMVPWLERMEDQQRVYGQKNLFTSQEEQTDYIRNWLKNDAKMSSASIELNIQWYTGWQSKIENSIYSMGDITSLISSTDIDVCILEEPEHLNWYRAPGESWTKKFPYVVGILHTNYFSYALDQPAALIRAPAMRLLCSWMCRAHCHRIIKLSGTLDKMAPEKELVENVHGVRETFLDAGRTVGRRLLDTSPSSSFSATFSYIFSRQDEDTKSTSASSSTSTSNKSNDPIFGDDADPKIYFIGKLLWSKGIGSLMELLKYAEESADLKNVKVDIYGGGPDMEAMKVRATKLELDMPFYGPLDHSELAFTHKIFVNPSTSEVLCTTSAEALAMNKFVILPSHPSNDFFIQFPNCLTYATKEEFVGNLYYAMTHSPIPLNDEYLQALSWEAATERLIMASAIPVTEHEQMKQFIDQKETSIEIPLPALLDTEEARKARENLANVLYNTRQRYRQFRDRLSSEMQSTRVLPNPIRERLVAELDKRLDIDIDEILDSPKLRIKLSPAELDKQLLELYDTLSESPGGDVLRIMGGGGQIALQNLYLKRYAERERWRKLNNIDSPPPILSLLPSFNVEDVRTEEFQRSASQWVRWSLRKNQQKLARSVKQTFAPSLETQAFTWRNAQSKLTIRKDPDDRVDLATTAVLTKSSDYDDDIKTTNSFNSNNDNIKTMDNVNSNDETIPKMALHSFRINRKSTPKLIYGSSLSSWRGLHNKPTVRPYRSHRFSILI